MGSTGAQVLLAKLESIDGENVRAYLHNIKVACIQNDGDGDNGGFIIYATTDNIWNDDRVISFGAVGSLGGTVNLPLRTTVHTNTDQASGSDGPVYIWAEVTDLGTTQNTARFIHEAWGFGHSLELQ